MSALAKILSARGKSVRGSDVAEGEYTASLTAAGIPVSTERDDPALDGCDVVVYTDAVRSDDAHIARAVRAGKPLVSRGKLLAALCACYGRTIAVAGCHGKTTCTAMLAHIFHEAGRSFTAHIGGNDTVFGNCVAEGDDYFITEACEYKQNFLLLSPDIAVILNSDADHLECYGGASELVAAYRRFAESSSKCVCLFGDACARGDMTFGMERGADFTASRISCDGGKYAFDILFCGRFFCSVSLSVYGRHNILNALAAAAAAHVSGVRPEHISSALSAFSGVDGRFQSIGSFNGCEVIADYAHHPREISAALRTACLITHGELYVIFRPHTYSRTKNLFADFVDVLGKCRHLLIYKTFAAREYFDADGSALRLSQALKNSRYAQSEREIEYFMRGARSGDKILVLGAGDISRIVKGLIG